MTDPDFAEAVRRAARQAFDAPRPPAREPVHPEVWREAVVEYRRGEGSPRARAFMRRALGEDDPPPVRVLSYPAPHLGGIEPDPTMVAHFNRMFREVEEAFEAAFPSPRPSCDDPTLMDAIGRMFGEEAERERVRRELVPLVRAAGGSPPPPPPRPPSDPYQPPYPNVLTVGDLPFPPFVAGAAPAYIATTVARGWGKTSPPPRPSRRCTSAVPWDVRRLDVPVPPD